MSTTNTTISEANETATTQVAQKGIVIGQFGDGRYSQAMVELFNDIQRLFKLKPEQAHIIARQFGVDFGAANKRQSLALKDAKISLKVSKGGERTLKEAVKSVKVLDTWALSAAMLTITLDELRQHGLVVHDVKLHKNIMESVDKQVSEATFAR